MIKKLCHDSENNFSKKRRFFQTFRKNEETHFIILFDIFKRILERQSEGHLTLDVMCNFIAKIKILEPGLAGPGCAEGIFSDRYLTARTYRELSFLPT